jgi:hypothetical protein
MEDQSVTRHRLSPGQFGMAGLLVLLTVLSVALAVYVRYYLVGVVCAAALAGVTLVAIGAARRRTSMIGLGALVAAASLILLVFGASQAVWVGQSLVSLTFIVVDDETDEPVPGATLRLRELPFEAGIPSPVIRLGEPGVETRANAQGRATVTYKFFSTGRAGNLLVRDTATAQILENFFVQVSANGYETRIVPLNELIGHRIDLAWPEQPPPVEFRLKRLGKGTGD